MFRTSVNPQDHIFSSPTYKSVMDEAIAFLRQTPVHSLPPPTGFPGAGVYMIYYLGDFEHYQHISDSNRESCRKPIYVGKAVPRGWRTARVSTNQKSKALFARLQEHRCSIADGKGLEPVDFRCRFVILEGIETDLISSLESQLFREFNPLWNTVIDGFGNHDPGSGRYNQAQSEWDVMHPGRQWATRLTGIPPRRDDILAKIRRVL